MQIMESNITTLIVHTPYPQIKPFTTLVLGFCTSANIPLDLTNPSIKNANILR